MLKNFEEYELLSFSFINNYNFVFQRKDFVKTQNKTLESVGV